jgi:hypothetical protein
MLDAGAAMAGTIDRHCSFDHTGVAGNELEGGV